jgi:putative ATP-dependent endonuclease of the OLD family
MTTHSPVVLRELSGNQLFVVRRGHERHEVIKVGTADGIQSAIRLYPDAFLAPSVLACEGASEVGLMRGLEQFRMAEGKESISACGVALVDCGGGDADRCFNRAAAFRALRYRTAILRDDDIEPTISVEDAFTADGGTVFAWRDGRTLEDELFLCLTDDAVAQLIDRAVDLHGEDLVNDHIKSVSKGAKDLVTIRKESERGAISSKCRAILGEAARTRKAGWFKSYQ